MKSLSNALTVTAVEKTAIETTRDHRMKGFFYFAKSHP